jgi:hypothetical protein
MFASVDEAVFGGMMGGGVCNPWTLDSPSFCTRESVAKMAVLGFFPHIGLGVRRSADGYVFPCDPDDQAVCFAQPYWNVLSAIDMNGAQVFNMPNQKPIAAVCADEAFRVIVYKARDRRYLAIVANLGAKRSQTRVRLLPEVLGMAGGYSIERVDARTGSIAPAGSGSSTFETGELPQWGIEGYRLTGK